MGHEAQAWKNPWSLSIFIYKWGVGKARFVHQSTLGQLPLVTFVLWMELPQNFFKLPILEGERTLRVRSQFSKILKIKLDFWGQNTQYKSIQRQLILYVHNISYTLSNWRQMKINQIWLWNKSRLAWFSICFSSLAARHFPSAAVGFKTVRHNLTCNTHTCHCPI